MSGDGRRGACALVDAEGHRRGRVIFDAGDAGRTRRKVRRRTRPALRHNGVLAATWRNHAVVKQAQLGDGALD